jgi:hypothetical protein
MSAQKIPCGQSACVTGAYPSFILFCSMGGHYQSSLVIPSHFFSHMHRHTCFSYINLLSALNWLILYRLYDSSLDPGFAIFEPDMDANIYLVFLK